MFLFINIGLHLDQSLFKKSFGLSRQFLVEQTPRNLYEASKKFKIENLEFYHLFSMKVEESAQSFSIKNL